MIHEKYRYSNTEEIVWHLKKFRRVNEDWQADFYDEYGRHMLTFENDEETLEALQDDDKLYTLVAEWLDFALMVNPEE